MVQLGQLLVAELGTDPMLNIPGGNGEAAHIQAKVQAQRNYLFWLRGHVAFLPRNLPEQIILEALEPGKVHSNATAEATKQAFLSLLTEGAIVDHPTAQEILAWSRLKIAKIPADNQDLTSIRHILQTWLHAY